MKILMTTDFYPPYVGGGVETVVFEISKRIALRGHEVHVLTSNLSNQSIIPDVDGVSVTRVGYFDASKYLGLQLSFSLDMGPAITRLVKIFEPDIVNAHNLFFYSTLAAARGKSKLGYPLVTTLHLSDVSALGGLSGYFAHQYENLVGKYIIEKSDRLIAVSDSVKKHAISLGASSQKIDLVPNAVDVKKFRPRQHVNNELKIVYVGRFVPNKGPLFFIEAARQIVGKRSDVSFTMIGEGPMREEVTTRIRGFGLSNKIKLIGVVPDLSEVLPDFDVLIRPTLTEGMPLMVLEGMASGLVVIASNVGGVPEVIEDYVNGILVKPVSTEEIVRAINSVLDNRELLNNIKANARRYIESYFDWDKVADMTIDTYSKILEGS